MECLFVALFALQLFRSRAWFDFYQLRIEDENRIGGNLSATRSTGSVSQLRRNRQLSLLTLTHTKDSLIPALDHLPSSQGKGEGSAAGVAAIELCSILQCSLE